MKAEFRIFQILLFFTSACLIRAQGTFIYDQQSSTEGNYQDGGADIQQNQPIGQSFIPQLSNVGFIRLFIYNGLLGNNSSATLYVNLRSDSIVGPVLSSTSPVLIQAGSFAGPVNFFFSAPVSLNPGSTYFLQPVVQDNDNFGLNQGFYNYPGGTAFLNSLPNTSNDLWFREGIIVPEPSSVALLLIGAGGLLWVRRLQTSSRSGAA